MSGCVIRPTVSKLVSSNVKEVASEGTQKHVSERITSFHQLDVYQQTYQASILVMTKLLPHLPGHERVDLRAQLSRSCKATPRLIAEGYAKRHQRHGFQKYLDDANGECNETIVSLSHCRDLYASQVDVTLCNRLIDHYDKAARQLYKLAISWSSFHKDRRLTQPRDETSLATDQRQTKDETGRGVDHRTT